MKHLERIRELREDNDYTQSTVAIVIHVAQTTYSDYEKGRMKNSLEWVIALAKLYDVDMNYIKGISDVKKVFPKK